MFHQELYNKILPPNEGNRSPKEILQEITNDYPYFSPAYFFLLKETPNTDHQYKKIAAKTALHFNNPFLLNYQLNRKVSLMVERAPAVIDIPESLAVETVSEVQKVDLKVSEERSPKKDELLFEPLHTTDYFASQGIKLSEEAQTADKLGKQLKSFTDWLKTMKKVNHGKLPEGNANIDLAVQHLAEKSNKEQEVITESMAEVYVQQGKAGKAREIYKKLSLLNPAKSAYFAAKLELLKEN